MSELLKEGDLNFASALWAPAGGVRTKEAFFRFACGVFNPSTDTGVSCTRLGQGCCDCAISLTGVNENTKLREPSFLSHDFCFGKGADIVPFRMVNVESFLTWIGGAIVPALPLAVPPIIFADVHTKLPLPADLEPDTSSRLRPLVLLRLLLRVEPDTTFILTAGPIRSNAGPALALRRSAGDHLPEAAALLNWSGVAGLGETR